VQDSKEILEAVSVLESIQGITTTLLHESKAGIEANHPFFRKHPDVEVQSRFRDLIHAWRELAFPGSAPAMVMASPDIDSMVAYSPGPASPPPKAAKPGSPEKRAAPSPASIGSDQSKHKSHAGSADEGSVGSKEAEKRRRESPSRGVATSASPAKQPKVEEALPKISASPSKISSSPAKTVASPAKTVASLAKKSSAKAKPQKKAVQEKPMKNAGNTSLVKMFEDLTEWEFKLAKELGDVKRRYAGVSYKKVCSLLRELDDQVISGASVQHLKGIGPAVVSKIDEFLSTGKVERLEKYRKGVYE